MAKKRKRPTKSHKASPAVDRNKIQVLPSLTDIRRRAEQILFNYDPDLDESTIVQYWNDAQRTYEEFKELAAGYIRSGDLESQQVCVVAQEVASEYVLHLEDLYQVRCGTSLSVQLDKGEFEQDRSTVSTTSITSVHFKTIRENIERRLNQWKYDVFVSERRYENSFLEWQEMWAEVGRCENLYGEYDDDADDFLEAVIPELKKCMDQLELTSSKDWPLEQLQPSSMSLSFLRNEPLQTVEQVPSFESNEEQLEQCRTRLNNINKVCGSIFEKMENDYYQKEEEQCEKIRLKHQANLDQEISKMQEDFQLKIEAAMERIAKQHEDEMVKIEEEAKKALDLRLKSLEEIRTQMVSDINEKTQADIADYRGQCQTRLDGQIKGLQEQYSADIQQYAYSRIETDLRVADSRIVQLRKTEALAAIKSLLNQCQELYNNVSKVSSPSQVANVELSPTSEYQQPRSLPGDAATPMITNKRQRTSYVIDRGKRDPSSLEPGQRGGYDQPGTTNGSNRLGTASMMTGVSHGSSDVFDRGKPELAGGDRGGQDLKGDDYEQSRMKLPPDKPTLVADRNGPICIDAG